MLLQPLLPRAAATARRVFINVNLEFEWFGEKNGAPEELG
jgi:hypothetical protein